MVVKGTINKIFFSALFFILVVGNSFSQSNYQQIWDEAVRLYEQKQYEKALNEFKKIEFNGKISSELFYNIANCYYKLSQPGYAILYYERALQMDPTDPDIRYNLELVRKQIPGLIKVPPKFFLLEWWDAFFDYVRFPISVWIFLISLMVFNLLFALKLVLRKTSWSEFLTRIIYGFLIVLALETAILIFDYRHDYTHHYGIFIQNKSAVRSEPFKESTVLYYVVQGQKAELLRRLNEWQEVLLPDGNKGWVEAAHILQIDPNIPDLE